MRETEKAAKIYLELKKTHGCFVFNIAGSIFQKRGMPDCLVISSGHYFWMEFKQLDEPIESAQAGVHRELAKQDVHVYVVRFIESNYWLVDEFYQIRFQTHREGVAMLWNLLQQLERNKKCVSLVITPVECSQSSVEN